MRIIISGTPGVGKTVISKLISSKFSLEYFHVSSFIIQNHLYESYDPLRNTYNIDDEKVAKEINSYLSNKNDVVIETIYPSLIDYADRIIILRKYPPVLHEELEKRRWSDLKIAENVEAEILGVILQEAIEWFKDKKPCQIDTTGKSPEEIVERIMKDQCEEIDWLSDERVQDLLFTLDKVISLTENK
ncbi:adenylate kinase family protein [Acidianus sp. HS-5]|uniref:adenylate kinase family protein n=1 Tax=Acidianus sp. HS-5 TaxID=2886040 RepID=UPI001F3D77CC|nr:adenylate kinase family protein [Acidianus sp. HS-5]BDC19459.1 adenylate kinase [Acidianus sp. HS-5]